MNYLLILKSWAFVLVPVFFGKVYFFNEEEIQKPFSYPGDLNLDLMMGITLCREMPDIWTDSAICQKINLTW
jgi:hypothetical protein